MLNFEFFACIVDTTQPYGTFHIRLVCGVIRVSMPYGMWWARLSDNHFAKSKLHGGIRCSSASRERMFTSSCVVVK